MGRDKAQLDWRGKSLGEHQAATLVGTGASPLFLSCRAGQPWTPRDFTRLEDRALDGGALEAFVEALAATDSAVTLVLAIDLPLVKSEWLAAMAVRAHAEEISVVPVRDGRFEPFAAAWHRTALPQLRDALARSDSLQAACAALRAAKFLHALEVTAVEAAQLANLNTPADAASLGCPV